MFVDKAGTTAAILDDNDMYPWGCIVPGVGKNTSNNTIKFTGQYRDADTAANLDYFGARYYSNTVGRFMSPDWAAKPTTVPYAKFGDPQSLNLYSYVENGPVNRIDVDGHWADSDCSVCNQGDSGFSVAPDAGTEAGLILCRTCEPSQPPGPQQQSQTVSYTTTILGQDVGVTIADNVPKDQQSVVRDSVDAVVSNINENADKLSKDDKDTIHKVKSITVNDDQRTGIDTKTGNLNFKSSYILGSSTPWLSSVFAHDGFHVVQTERGEKYNQKTATRLEHEANLMQIRAGTILGLSQSDIDYINRDTHTLYNTTPY